MSLPQPIRAHRARPLPWLVAALALIGVVVAFGYRGLHDYRVWARTALHAEGVVAEAPRGGQLRVAYRHPVTHQRIKVRVDTWGKGDHLRAGDAVALDVDADNPERLTLAGEHKPPVDGASLVVLLAVPLVVCAVRWWSVERTARLVRSGGPTFALLGAVAPSGWLRRKPLLHLYALDAAPGDPSLCAVRVLNTAGVPLGGAAFPVQVKGVPRPMARVAARAGGGESGGGERRAGGERERVLWPAARAVMGATLPRPARVVDPTPPPPAHPRDLPAWVATGGRFEQRSSPLIGLGPALGLLAFFVVFAGAVTIGTVRSAAQADEARRGRVRAVAEVVARRHRQVGEDAVDIRYRYAGRELAATVGVARTRDYTVGRRYPVLVDPTLDHRVVIAKERFSRGEQVVFAWLPVIPVAVWAGRALRTWRRARSAARRGPWFRLELWPGTAETLLLGDQAAGYVRGAIVGREAVPTLRRLWAEGGALGPSPLWALTPPGAPVTVAGQPEAGGVVALIDGDGAVYVVSERLRVPPGAAHLAPLTAVPGR